MQLTDQPDVVTISFLGVYIDACIRGIAQSDSRTVAEVTATFNIHVTITSIFSVEITKLLDTVVVEGNVPFFSVCNLQLYLVSIASHAIGCKDSVFTPVK